MFSYHRMCSLAVWAGIYVQVTVFYIVIHCSQKRLHNRMCYLIIECVLSSVLHCHPLYTEVQQSHGFLIKFSPSLDLSLSLSLCTISGARDQKSVLFTLEYSELRCVRALTGTNFEQSHEL